MHGKWTDNCPPQHHETSRALKSVVKNMVMGSHKKKGHKGVGRVTGHTSTFLCCICLTKRFVCS